VIRSVAGRVRQPFTVCFHAGPASGTTGPRPDQVETSAAEWIDPARLDTLAVHPAMRIWIVDAVDRWPGRVARGRVEAEDLPT
jgi:hypothetical protein